MLVLLLTIVNPISSSSDGAVGAGADAAGADGAGADPVDPGGIGGSSDDAAGADPAGRCRVFVSLIC